MAVRPPRLTPRRAGPAGLFGRQRLLTSASSSVDLAAASRILSPTTPAPLPARWRVAGGNGWDDVPSAGGPADLHRPLRRDSRLTGLPTHEHDDDYERGRRLEAAGALWGDAPLCFASLGFDGRATPGVRYVRALGYEGAKGT